MSSHESASAASPTSEFASQGLAVPGGWAFLVAALGLASVVVTHLVNFGTDHLRVQALDAGLDSSWSHRVDAAALAAGTVVALVGTSRSQAHRMPWGLTAAILGFLAIDEISTLHTRVDAVSWGKALYAPLLVVLAVCVWRLSDRTDQALIVRGGLLMLVVSFGIHVFGLHVVHLLGWSSSSWAYQVKVALKQGTELAGWVLLLIGLWGLASKRRLLM
jgi:hypothetical protein